MVQKSGEHQLRLVVSPIIYELLHPRWYRISSINSRWRFEPPKKTWDKTMIISLNTGYPVFYFQTTTDKYLEPTRTILSEVTPEQ